MNRDQIAITRCLELAHKAAGHTSPNPLVGAVIVRNGRVLAEGYHHKAGYDHAEIVALKKIAFKANGATLYCNLEPCCHHGRTPPCIDRIITSGISKVVIAITDPNPKVCGRSIRLLKKNGIHVKVGVLEKKARFLNRIYLTWMTKKRPYVVMKVAMSLDGKIGAPPRHVQQWITSKESRLRVYEIRSKVDGILVGVDTVLQDDPRLTVRGIKNARQPWRIVLDSRLRTPSDARLFKSKGGKVIIATTAGQKESAIRLLEETGAEVITVDAAPDGRVSLKDLLAVLANRGMTSLMIEGGGRVFSAFINEGLCDEMIMMIAPRFLGAGSLTAFPEAVDITSRNNLVFYSLALHGPDCELRYLTERHF